MTQIDAFKLAHYDSYKVTHDKAYGIEWVGKRVVKISGKPFKSGAKIGTVAGLTVHPKTQRLCFTFVEDSSYVEAFRCEPVKDQA